MPSSPDTGVPLRVAVPSPLSTKLRLAGSGYDGEISGLIEYKMIGAFEKLAVVIVTVPKLPRMKLILLALVMAGAGGGSFIVRVKDWMASGSAPLLAVKVSG